MKSKLFFLIFGFISFVSLAQEYDIKGVVYEASTGMPMPGVNVALKDLSKGTTTDFDGNFTLNGIKKGSEIVFSYIGFKNQSVIIQNGNELSISLEEDTNALEEVVVIGFGSQKKKEVTGAVVTVGEETIAKMDPINVSQSLQGTTSGVNVTPTGGTPGAEANIRIRGVSTNGENKPLIILDGFQYEGGLNSINPQDIENITVLKDAQAAIYGTIGANGVILVTTKKGKRNQAPKISYSGYMGIQETTRKLPLLNATEYALLLNESYANAGQTLPFSNVSGLGAGTDWQDQVFETANVNNHNISVRGGSEKISYSLSGSTLWQQGIVAPDKANFNRNTGSITLDADVRKGLKLSTKLFYNSTISRNINAFSLGSVLFNAANIAPTIAPDQYNLDGTISLGNEVVNPLAQIDNTFNKYVTNRLSGTFQATFEYAKHLDLQARFGFNTSNTKNRDFTPEYYYGANKIYTNSNSSVTLGMINDNDYTFDLFNTYQNTFWEDHNITVMLGMTSYETKGQGLYGSRTGVQANSWTFADLSSANGVGEEQTNSSYAYLLRRLSYFARLQYNYKGKYLLSAMYRRDSSTRFGPNNRVANFPSVTAGWLISEEDFFNKDGFVNTLKLRSSYGILGNDQIPNYAYLALLNGEATYVLGDDQILVNGNALGTLPNPDLKWEQAKKFDVGLDLTFWKDKLSFTMDYFLNKRDNLLLVNIPVSGILGAGAPGAASPTKNAGSVENKGFEFAINYNEKISDDFSFSVGYNVSTLKNEVTGVNGTAYVEGGAFGVGQLAPARMQVGKPIGYFYGYKTDGIFQTQAEVDAHPSQLALGAEAQPGDIRYVDINGDGVINSDDRTDLGNPIPTVTMGFNISVNYKNFDLSAYSFANLGNEIVRNYERDQPNVNKMSYWLDRWTGPGTSNTVPRVTTAATANKVFSDFYVEDGSFARIQTISLGYTVPSTLVEKIGLDRFRIYGKVDNVCTFTKYSGYDPTASTGSPIGGGIDLGFYPLPRTYMLGVNLEF